MLSLRRKQAESRGWHVASIIACCLLWLTSQLAICSCWQVSNLGRVKNTRGKISCGNLHAGRYCHVLISCEAGCKRFLVHRLVAFAFHGAPSSPLLVVHHIDGNGTNNAACNLEYVTQSENVRHSLRKRRAPQTLGCRPRAVKARQVGTAAWQTFSSQKCAADALGVSRSSVWRCCNGKVGSCCGHEFQFVQDAELPGEVWKDAVDPKTRSALSGYRISSCGRVEGPFGVRTYGRYGYGYQRIWYKGRDIRVHRIMACTFLDVSVSDKAPWEVNHLDGNKSNNSIENLEVVNRSENVLHAWQMRAKRGVVSARMPVIGRHLLTGAKFNFASVTEAARHVSKANASSIPAQCGISACCKGRKQNFRGYEWGHSFASDAEERPDEMWKDVDIPGLLAAWNVSR